MVNPMSSELIYQILNILSYVIVIVFFGGVFYLVIRFWKWIKVLIVIGFIIVAIIVWLLLLFCPVLSPHPNPDIEFFSIVFLWPITILLLLELLLRGLSTLLDSSERRKVKNDLKKFIMWLVLWPKIGRYSRTFEEIESFVSNYLNKNYPRLEYTLECEIDPLNKLVIIRIETINKYFSLKKRSDLARSIKKELEKRFPHVLVEFGVEIRIDYSPNPFKTWG